MQTAAEVDARPRVPPNLIVGLGLLAGLAALAVWLASHAGNAHIQAVCDSDDPACASTYHVARAVYVGGAIVIAAVIALFLRYAKRSPRDFTIATWVLFATTLFTLAGYTLYVFSTTDACG